jgi:hypothetical protein
MGKTSLHDLTGARIGNILVLERGESRRSKTGKRTGTRWKCLCDCGTVTESLYSNIVNGTKKTCGKVGCPYHHAIVRRGYAPGEAGLRQAWNLYRRKALERKLEFTLTQDETNAIFRDICFYCGAPPGNVAKSNTGHGGCLYTGIDRIDSTKGYIQGNVRPCCWPCNRMKSTMPQGNFIGHIQNVLKFLKKNGRMKCLQKSKESLSSEAEVSVFG